MILKTKKAKQEYLDLISEVNISSVLYELIADSDNFGIVITTPGGEILGINKANLEIYGFDTLEDFDRNHANEGYVREEDRLFLIEELTKNGKIEKFETQQRKNDGSVFWTSTTSQFVTANSGQQVIINIIEDITERKNSEMRFKELFDNMKSAVAIYKAIDDGKDFVFKDFNKTGEKLEKISKDDLIGKKVTEAFPGIKELGLYDVFQEVWKTGEPAFHPISFYKDNKITGWRENYVYKLPQGEIVAIYEDVTKRKQAEEELKNKDSALETSILGIVMANLDGNITYVNPKLMKLWGFKREHIEYGKTSAHALAQSDPKIVRNMISELKTKGVYSSEFLSKKVDGTPFWVSMNAHTIFDNKKKAIGWMASFLDISERKEFEHKLEESENRFREIFEKSVIGMAIMDTNGIPVFNNSSLQQMLGYSKEELMKIPFMTFTHPEDVEKDLHYFQELMQGKRETLQTESRFIRKDKEVIWVNVLVSVLKDEDGKPYNLIGMAENITNRKQTEVLLKQSTVTRDLVGSMFHDLKNIGSLTDRDVFLVGNKLAKGVEAKTLEECISAFKNMGLGDIKIEEIDDTKGRWVFSGDNLVERLKDSKNPTDNYALGYLCGTVSKISDHKNVAGVEIECQSMNDERCRFVIQKK